MKIQSRFLFCTLIALLAAADLAFAQAPVEVVSITTSWGAPIQREDGTAFTADEIGGYMLKHKKASETIWQTVPLTKTTGTYVFKGDPKTSYDFQIAVYDTKGIYSNYVSLPYVTPVKPKPPSEFRITTVGTSTVAK